MSAHSRPHQRRPGTGSAPIWRSVPSARAATDDDFRGRRRSSGERLNVGAVRDDQETPRPAPRPEGGQGAPARSASRRSRRMKATGEHHLDLDRADVDELCGLQATTPRRADGRRVRVRRRAAARPGRARVGATKVLAEIALRHAVVESPRRQDRRRRAPRRGASRRRRRLRAMPPRRPPRRRGPLRLRAEQEQHGERAPCGRGGGPADRRRDQAGEERSP